jgi:hypothetical protein
LIHSIMEENNTVDFNYVDDLDYYDALFIMFRNWVNTNLPDSEKDAPISYLLEKYGKKFIQELIGDDPMFSNDNFEISRWSIPRIVQSIVKKGLYKLPSKRKYEKFTERFKRPIKYFIDELNLPPWANIELIENSPYKVNFKVVLDFPEMVKSEETRSVYPSNLEREFTKFAESFLGVEFGNPNHGHLDIDRLGTEYKNLDSWVKTVLNKEIKTKIRSLPYGKYVHSMKFEPKETMSSLKIVFKSTAPWNASKSDFKQQVTKLLNDSGYKKIRVEY